MYSHDFLNYIPDCVPEYYRSLQEEENHQCELRMERQERYSANREKIRSAVESGLPILDYGGYDACWECGHADHNTMTWDDDDFARVICRNPLCPLHKAEAEEETK